MPSTFESSAPFGKVVSVWMEKIAKAEEFKEKEYRGQAREAHKFFDSCHDFMYSGKYATDGIGMQVQQATGDKIADESLAFRMTLNKVSEGVDRIGPRLYFDNPTRTVRRRMLDIDPSVFNAFGPMMAPYAAQSGQMGQEQAQIVSALLGPYLNYTPREMDLAGNSWRGIQEALVGGVGVLWTEIYHPRGMNARTVGSFWDSGYDNLGIDPDVAVIHDAQFVYRRCVAPVWQVEEEYGWPKGSLKANMESSHSYASSKGDTRIDSLRARGSVNDLLVYYKIYSRMGLGGRFSQASGDDPLWDALAEFGDNVFLVIAEGNDQIINLPPQVLEMDLAEPGSLDTLEQALAWPIKFWGDPLNPWPFSLLTFHVRAGSVWPAGHFKAALGELKLMNWLMSFLAGHVKWSSRVILAMAEEIEPEIEDQVVNGNSLTVIRFKKSANKALSELVETIRLDPPPDSVYRLFQLGSRLFDLRSGLTPIMYGESETQFRSAAEAELKGNNASSFIDWMQKVTADWQALISRKEAIAARTVMGPPDVAPIFQEQWNDQNPLLCPLSLLWGQHVYRPNPADLEQVCREFDYTIEAESLRRPNQARELANIDQMFTSIGSWFWQYFMQFGDPTYVNWMVSEWSRVRQMTAPPPFQPMQMQPPPMLPPSAA